MKDLDVRRALRRELDSQHRADARTRIVEEMGVWSGSVRVDVAVINGELCGYEIKSARDTLTRLPSQQLLYSQVFDRVTLVVAERHSLKATTLIPSWWGILVAAAAENAPLRLCEERPAAENPDLDPVQLARLLWRPEALAVLSRYELAKGYRAATAEKLWRRLASELPLDVLRLEVREALKSRANWSRKSVDDERKVSVGIDLHPLSPAARADG